MRIVCQSQAVRQFAAAFASVFTAAGHLHFVTVLLGLLVAPEDRPRLTPAPGGGGLVAMPASSKVPSGQCAHRPDLHFAYNLVETAPLIVAFASQVEALRRGGGQRVQKAVAAPTQDRARAA